MASRNHWRRESHNNDLNWHECKAKLLKYYPENQISNDNGGFVVNETYLVSPHKKWKRIGKNTWYFYKNIDDLVTRYFKKGISSDNN